MSDRTFRELTGGQVDSLRDQLRTFVGGGASKQQGEEIKDAEESPCSGGSGSGHSSHCDSDGWV